MFRTKKYDLIVYRNDDGTLSEESTVEFGSGEIVPLKEAFRIKTYSKSAKIIDIDNGFVLYGDNSLYIYNSNDKKTQKVNIRYDDEELYYLHLNEDKNVVLGVLYQPSDSKITYYDIAKDKKIIAKFDDAGHISFKDISDEYISVRGRNNKAYLFNLETGNIDLQDEFITDNVIFEYDILKSNNQKIIVLDLYYNNYWGYLKIYTNNLKLIEDYSKEHYDESGGFTIEQLDIDKVTFKDGILTINEDDIIKTYDVDGNLLSKVRNK